MRSSLRTGIIPALALGLALAGCGGEDEEAVSLTTSFAAGSLAIDEDAGTANVSVVLHTSQGTIASGVRVTVVDAGSGSATSGSDYAAFAPAQVTFPGGSADGSVQQVTLTLIDDATVEGANETIDLALVGPQGVELSEPSALSLTVRDAQTATIEFTVSSNSTSDETPASYGVSAQLSLDPGVTLGVDASAQLGDAGTGTATAGSDYTSITPLTVLFPAGSSDGAVQNTTIDVLGDAVVEGNESVRLSLSQAAPGTSVGAAGVHQLTIVDDDVTASSFLAASEGASGTENPLTYNSLVDLGAQTIDAGPNAGTLLRLSNIGGSALAISAPNLTGSHANDFAVEVESANLSMGAPLGSPAFELSHAIASPLVPLAELGTDATRFVLDPLAMQEMRQHAAVHVHGFRLPGGEQATLDLRRMALPFSADARLVIDGVEVPGGPASQLGDLSLWRGSVLEAADSKVFLALSSEGTRGFIEIPGAADRIVHVLSEAPVDGALPVVRVADEWQLASLGIEPPTEFCGGALEAGEGGQLAAPTPVPAGQDDAPGVASLTVADARLAIETDYQLFAKFGSSGATTTYVTGLIAAISDRYQTDIQTSLSIAYLGVYTTAGDPWSSQDSGGDAGDVLDEFRAAWNGSGWPASADLAHFISGANLGGGVAYVGVLCNSTFGYGVSGNINGNINWGTWSGTPSGMTWDFVVVAHELGHNFGTNHTHSYCPPLDRCSSNCNGSTQCTQGTIMSYCHTCPGGMNNIAIEFHPVVADVMRSSVNASCLGQSALAGGDWVQYLVRFNPLTQAGTRNANVDFVHDAANHPTPFRVRLRGSASN